ncbi:MAG: enoyl-CoA hydratase-related protein [Pseudomonadota bacterium]
MISTQVVGAIGRVVIDRPDKLNALTIAMYTQLAEALAAHDADPDVKVVLVTSTGADFSAGNDLANFASNTSLNLSELANPQVSPHAHAVDQMIRMRKPVIAAVQGRAIGFGATMLLHFDSLVLEEGASLNFPFVELSLVPEAASTILLEAHVGRLQARKIIFDAAPISAEHAKMLGLATTIVPKGEGETEAMAIAVRWSARDVSSLVRTKALMNVSAEQLQGQAAREFECFAKALEEPETKARFRAMLAK